MWIRMDNFLQQQLVAVSLLTLIIAFVIFCFGVDKINFQRFLGSVCNNNVNNPENIILKTSDENNGISFPSDKWTEFDWENRNKEILTLLNCKKDGKWLVDCVENDGVDVLSICTEMEKDCWDNLIKKNRKCAQDVELLCFEPIEALKPLVNHTETDLFTPKLDDNKKLKLLKEWPYFTMREEIIHDAAKAHQIFDFWSDKYRTKSCLGDLVPGATFSTSQCSDCRHALAQRSNFKSY